MASKAHFGVKPIGKWECILTAITALLLRLAVLAPYPAGWDDVDFVLALGRYDLSAMQPHFPGYPVYIVAAHFFGIWTDDPFQALALLSAFTGGLSVIPLWLLFRSWGNLGIARLTVWLYILAPLPWISGVQPTSDAMGAFLAAWLAAFSWAAVNGGGSGKNRGQRAPSFRIRSTALVAAGAALGLLLGVRISYASLSVLWIGAVVSVLRDGSVPWARRLTAAAVSAAAAAAVCIGWLSALVLSEGGLLPFIRLAVAFTEGHFTDWGGAYHSDSSMIARAGYFIFRQMGAAGLGTVWYGATDMRWLPTLLTGIGVLGAAAGAWKLLQRGSGSLPLQAKFLLLWIVPYLLWAFFAQNVEKPRHILPLLPPLLYVLVWGWERIVRQIGRFPRGGSPEYRKRLFLTLGMVWTAGTIAVSLPLLMEAHQQVSPMMRLAEYVKRDIPADSSLIFTWEEKRVITYESPQHTVIRLRHWEDLRKEILQYGQQPMTIYATNAVLNGLDRPAGHLFQQVNVFQGSPWIYPTYHTIILYKGSPALVDVVREGKGE